MTIIYRISDSGYVKIKPPYINNENCLRNASSVFSGNWLIIADNCADSTLNMIKQYKTNIMETHLGSGAQTFNIALDEALKLNDEEIVYFIENDYLHTTDAQDILLDGFKLGANYVTLYLHPDKFIPPHHGGNPEVDSDGGYMTKIYKGNKELFAMFNSTTMTFAAQVKTLREDEQILRQFTSGTYPEDYKMFLALRDKGRSLICPLNTKSTHGESQWLAPFVDWKSLI